MIPLRVRRTRRMPRHSEGVKRPKNLSDGGRKLYGTEVLVKNVSAEFGEILLPTAVGIRMTLSYGDRQLRRVHVTLREVHDRRVSSMVGVVVPCGHRLPLSLSPFIREIRPRSTSSLRSGRFAALRMTPSFGGRQFHRLYVTLRSGATKSLFDEWWSQRLKSDAHRNRLCRIRRDPSLFSFAQDDFRAIG
jgi:hypothetical protein